MTIGLIVPVMKNFKGLAQLIASVDVPIVPYIINNWDHNHGVSVGWNMGLERTMVDDIEFALVCNDDVILNKGTVDKLINLMSGYDLVTAVNSRDRNEEWEGLSEHVDYSCFMVRPLDFVSDFGLFDENFSPAYFEDNDMAYRIKVAGGRQVCDLSAKMFHAGSVTQNMGGPVVDSPMFEANRAYYIRKWGGQPGEETYTTPFNEGGDIRKW